MLRCCSVLADLSLIVAAVTALAQPTPAALAAAATSETGSRVTFREDQTILVNGRPRMDLFAGIGPKGRTL